MNSDSQKNFQNCLSSTKRKQNKIKHRNCQKQKTTETNTRGKDTREPQMSPTAPLPKHDLALRHVRSSRVRSLLRTPSRTECQKLQPPSRVQSMSQTFPSHGMTYLLLDRGRVHWQGTLSAGRTDPSLLPARRLPSPPCID